MPKAELRSSGALENLPEGWTLLGDLFVDDKCTGVLFVDDEGFLRYHPEGALYEDKWKRYSVYRNDLNLRLAPRRP